MSAMQANAGYTIFRAIEEPTETTQSLLYVPESSRENQHMIFGVIVSCGGPNSKDTFVLDLVAGNTIATLKNKAIKFSWKNEELYLVHTSDIMFVAE